MRRLLLALVLLCLAAGGASAQCIGNDRGLADTGGVLCGTNAPPYEGQVQTRSGVPNSFAVLGGTNMMMARTYGYVRKRNGLSYAYITIPNWYSQGGVETGTGASATVAAAVEYPVGTCTPATFSLSNTGVLTTGLITSGLMLKSDLVPVPGNPPNGTKVFERIWYSNTAGLPLSGIKDTAGGDALLFGTTGIADTTASCAAMTDQGTVNAFFPAAVTAQTTDVAIMTIGDSRDFGAADTYVDASGDIGEINRSIGPYFAYINDGESGSGLEVFVAHHTNALILAQYASHFILQLGINSVYAASRTPAQMEADQQTIVNLLSPKPVFRTTVGVETTSTDSWAVTGNQSVITGNANRIIFNNFNRALPSYFAGVFEVANPMENAPNGGLWALDGTAGDITSDGIHGHALAYLKVTAANAIPRSAFHRP